MVRNILNDLPSAVEPVPCHWPSSGEDGIKVEAGTTGVFTEAQEVKKRNTNKIKEYFFMRNNFSLYRKFYRRMSLRAADLVCRWRSNLLLHQRLLTALAHGASVGQKLHLPWRAVPGRAPSQRHAFHQQADGVQRGHFTCLSKNFNERSMNSNHG